MQTLLANGTPLKPWAEKTTAEKVVSLRSERADLVRQMRREIHTSRSSGGIERRINKIDKQLAELE